MERSHAWAESFCFARSVRWSRPRARASRRVASVGRCGPSVRPSQGSHRRCPPSSSAVQRGALEERRSQRPTNNNSRLFNLPVNQIKDDGRRMLCLTAAAAASLVRRCWQYPFQGGSRSARRHDRPVGGYIYLQHQPVHSRRGFHLTDPTGSVSQVMFALLFESCHKVCCDLMVCFAKTSKGSTRDVLRRTFNRNAPINSNRNVHSFILIHLPTPTFHLTTHSGLAAKDL